MDVTCITADMLKNLNITTVLTDIDNTLALPHDRIPFDFTSDWLESLRKEGIRIVAVSNNTEERAAKTCNDMGLEYISRAAKPLGYKIRSACDEKGISVESCVVVGDQIFTDVLCAKLLGVKSILVTPKVHEGDTLFKIKRALERIILHDKEWCR